MNCTLCSISLPSLRAYISHLRLVHKKDPNFNVACIADGCSRVFSSFGGFGSHVYRHHRDKLGICSSSLSDSAPEQPVVSENDVDNFPHGAVGNDDNFPHDADDHSMIAAAEPEPQRDITYDVWHLLGISAEERKKSAAAFLLKLREICRVSEKSVIEIMEGSFSLFNEAFMTSKAEISALVCLAGANTSQIDGFHSMQLPNPFVGLETIYKQDRYFKQHFNYVVSQHFNVLGIIHHKSH